MSYLLDNLTELPARQLVKTFPWIAGNSVKDIDAKLRALSDNELLHIIRYISYDYKINYSYRQLMPIGGNYYPYN